MAKARKVRMRLATSALDCLDLTTMYSKLTIGYDWAPVS